jgi:acetyl esterase/lipase
MIAVVCLVVGYVLLMYTNMKKIKRMKLAYPLEENHQIRVTKDIVYKTVEGKNLLMDVYAPANAVSGEKLPVVIFVHGEGLEVFIKDAKDWGIYTSYGKLLASKGYIAITFNHRYATKNFLKIKEIEEEVKAAVIQVQNNSEQWNADIDNIFVWSFSLGGIYSSLFLRNDYHIKAVISYYGLLDLSTRIPLKLQKGFEEYTPDQYLRNIGETKIMIVKAVKDKVAGVNQSIDNFIKAAEKYKIEYKYLIHNTGGHSFDILIENEETKEIIDQTIGFIENISHNK